jgi:hypothetical protein
VRHRRRPLAAMKAAHRFLDRLVGERDALVLAQVLDP